MTDIPDLIFFLSEIILLVSYMVTGMVSLRIIACCADLGFIGASFWIGLDSPGMLPTFSFACLSFSINTVHVCRLLYLRFPQSIPSFLTESYKTTFHNLSTREYMLLIDSGQRRQVPPDITIIKAQSRCNLFYILKGEVNIKVDGNVIASVGAHQFVGEVSFIAEQPSIAEVVSSKSVEVIAWEEKNLDRLENDYPDVFLRFYDILLRNLAKKLSSQNTAYLSKSIDAEKGLLQPKGL
jgi:hypothetical protein